MRSAATVLSTVVLTLLGVFVVATPASAAGTTYVWRGSASQAWGLAANWSPTGVPGNGDSVTVEATTDDVCHAHVTGVPDGLQLADLTVDEYLHAGNPASPCLTSLDGGSITVTHTLTFHAGTIDTPITIAAGATATVTPGAAIDTTHFGGAVTVDGVLTLANTTDPENLSLTGGPGITVDAGGALTTQGDNHVSANCCSSPAHLVNHGTVQLGAGTLDLDAVELDQDATLNATGGAQVLTTFAPQTAGPGARWTGSGSWQLGYSSDTTVTGTQTLGSNFRWLYGGNGSTAEEHLAGTFALSGGRFEWGGGSIDAAMTVGTSTTFVATGADGPDTRQIDGLDANGRPVAITNRGSMTFSGGAGWHGVSGARIANASTGVITLGAGTAVSADCCGTPAAIVNNGGTVNVPAGAGTVTVDNTGLKSTGGTVSIGAGSDLELTGGAPGSLSSATITGGGTVGIAAPITTTGTETVGADTTVALEDDGAWTTGGSAATTIGGAGGFDWTGGTVTGTLTVATAGGQTISGADAIKSIRQPTGARPSVVTLNGPTTVAAGTDAASDTVQTAGTSRLVFAGDLALAGNTYFSGGFVSTNGTTTVAAGDGPALFSNATLTNAGALTVASGTLQSYSSITQTGGSATVAPGAVLTVTGSSNALRVTGGSLAGGGQVTGNVVIGAATLAPGGGGTATLTVTGTLTTAATSTLLFDLGATASDQVSVGGAATVRGTLRLADLAGYAPPPGTRVAIVTAAALALGLACTTTTGSTTRYWTAARSGAQLVLTSRAGTPGSC